MLNSAGFLLCSVGTDGIIGIVVGIVLALIVGAGVAYLIFRYAARKKLGSVKEECARLLDSAKSNADTYLKEARLEIKEEQHKMRSELDKESRERRSELQRTENRLSQREDQLASRELLLDKKSASLDDRKKGIEAKEQEIAQIQCELSKQHDKMLEQLEKVAQLTQEEAKAQLMEQLLDEVRKDAGEKAREIEQSAKDEAEKRARNIVGQAVQRCAVDHSSEICVSTVELPGDEMKGRLIGRVGRNIRTIENCTGVDLIIDDTPDVVTVSAFYPVRREVA